MPLLLLSRQPKPSSRRGDILQVEIRIFLRLIVVNYLHYRRVGRVDPEHKIAVAADFRRRLLRGGSFNDDQEFVRSAARGEAPAYFRHYSYGFRVARSLP